MAVWLMAGTEVRVPGPAIPGPPGEGWLLASAGDFTGLLEQGAEIPAPPGEGWIVGNAGDCNGDGMWDVLWLDTEPLRMRVWLMNGTVPLETGPDIPGPAGR
jgi:hypothetical protein